MKYFSDEDLKRIEAAITDVESVTNAEVVTVVARSSTHFGHVDNILFLIALLGIFASGLWDLQIFTWHQPIAWAVIDGLLALGLAWSLSRLSWVQRLLTDRASMAAQAWQRAELEFHRTGITNTAERTGILIFISLLEHQAVVLADKAINDKTPQTEWQNLVNDIVDGIRSKDVTEGLLRGLKDSKAILSKNHPRGANDKNELHNALIFRD